MEDLAVILGGGGEQVSAMAVRVLELPPAWATRVSLC